MTESGGFIIQIADYVFEGAYERNIGGYRMHIMHEIMDYRKNLIQVFHI